VSVSVSSPAAVVSEYRADELDRRLADLGLAASIFGTAVSGIDVNVNWRLGAGTQTVLREQPASGRTSVSISLDLHKAMRLLDSTHPCRESPQVDAFLAGFLHELGHVLYGSDTFRPLTPGTDEEWPGQILESADQRELLETITDTLEDARVERHLLRDFRGARRHLRGHALQVVRVAEAPGGNHLDRLIAMFFLQLWEGEDMVAHGQLPPDVISTADELRASLLAASSSSRELRMWCARELLPRLSHFLHPPTAAEHHSAVQQEQLSRHVQGETVEKRAVKEHAGQAPPQLQTSGDSAESAGGASDCDYRVQRESPSDGIRRVMGLSGRVDGQRRLHVQGALTPAQERLAERRPITYPHVSRGLVIMDEIGVAQARHVAPDPRAKGIWTDVAKKYGPWALSGFGAHRVALRRAIQANCRHRFKGRFRTGHRIGIGNARRFVTQEDLRLFQHARVSDRPSYYFHLLVDVSPSMLRDDNVQKALACSYAFAEVLVESRIPVDVSLYSSAITLLFDHRHDSLEPYFGGDGGFLSSGTHEIEAIAFAKQRAESVAERSRLILVITDGHPNAAAVHRAGGESLSDYYRGTLAPWLSRCGIELLCIGIGASVNYHPHSVAVSSGWEALEVLAGQLTRITARTREPDRLA